MTPTEPVSGQSVPDKPKFKINWKKFVKLVATAAAGSGLVALVGATGWFMFEDFKAEKTASVDFKKNWFAECANDGKKSYECEALWSAARLWNR